MRKYILAVLLCLITGIAHSATYYVSAAGSNTSPYDTWAKAATTIITAANAGNADTGGDGPHIMYIAPGTYAEALNFTDADWIDGTFICTASASTTTAAARGQGAILTAASSNAGVLVNQITGLTFYSLSITNSDTSTATNRLFYNYPDASTTFYDAYLYDSAGRFFTNSSTVADSTIFIRALMAGAKGNTSLIQNTGTGSTSIIDSVITQSLTNGLGGGTSAVGLYVTAGTMNFFNNVMTGMPGKPVFLSNGTLNLYGNVFDGSYTDDLYTITRNAGTLNLRNNIIGASYGYGTQDRFTSGTIAVNSGNITRYQPKFTHRLRSGIIVPTCDGRPGYVKELEDVFSSRGLTGKGTLYLNGFAAYSNAEYITDAQYLVDNGIWEVMNHSWSHSGMDSTGTFFTITKADSTIDIDRENNRIVVDPGGTVSGIKTKTVSAIKGELQALGCTISEYTEGMVGPMKGEGLTDSAGAQASPYAVQLATLIGDVEATADNGAGLVRIASTAHGLTTGDSIVMAEVTGTTEANGVWTVTVIDANTFDLVGSAFANAYVSGGSFIAGFYKAETYDAQQYLKSIVSGTDFEFFATPGGQANATVNKVLRISGHESNRNTGDGSYLLSSLDIFNTTAYFVSFVTDACEADENEVKGRMRQICNDVANRGILLYLLAHDTVGSDYPEATPEQWGWILDVIAEYPEIQVMNTRQALTWLQANSTTADNITYAYTFTDQSDYSLQSDSPAIRTGAEAHLVGLTGDQTDYFGNSVNLPYRYDVNIGADLYKYGYVAPSILAGKILTGRLVP